MATTAVHAWLHVGSPALYFGAWTGASLSNFSTLTSFLDGVVQLSDKRAGQPGISDDKSFLSTCQLAEQLQSLRYAIFYLFLFAIASISLSFPVAPRDERASQ